MPPVEIRDLDVARQFILQGLVLQRVATANAKSIPSALHWCLEIAASGHPLPPVGFVADLGHILMGGEGGARRPAATPTINGLPGGLMRAYEDFVLGKFFADGYLERAGHVVRRLAGRERTRAVAFVVEQFRSRAEIGGVLLSPAVLKSLLETAPDDALRQGWDLLQHSGLLPLIGTLYGELVVGARRTAEALAPEDLFELEHGTALADLSQRVALRQILWLTARLESAMQRIDSPTVTQREVPTAILDEDVYPVGGFASLSTRGSVESLLHSQLAYMEPAGSPRPDLFDVKYLRDELLYYSRDENQFLRRRRSFAFVLSANLREARFKDPELPAQRLIMALALVCAAIRRLTDWLSIEALHFTILLPAGDSLAQEHALFRMLFREMIANGTVTVTTFQNEADASQQIEQMAIGRLHRTLTISTDKSDLSRSESTSGLVVSGPRPTLQWAEAGLEFQDLEAAEAWPAALERLLQLWTM